MPGNCDSKEFSALQSSRLFYFFRKEEKKTDPKSYFMCCPGNSVLLHIPVAREN